MRRPECSSSGTLEARNLLILLDQILSLSFIILLLLCPVLRQRSPTHFVSCFFQLLPMPDALPGARALHRHPKVCSIVCYHCYPPPVGPCILEVGPEHHLMLWQGRKTSKDIERHRKTSKDWKLQMRFQTHTNASYQLPVALEIFPLSAQN